MVSELNMQNVSLRTERQSLTGEQRLLYRAPYCDIIVMARFGGNILERPLRQALAKAKLKYPLMSARIEQDSKGNAQIALGNVAGFQIKIFDKKTEHGWFELAFREQMEPFNLSKGPLIKFLLLQSAESSDLVVICHHVICDALSLVYLVKDIASFLNGPEKKVNPFPMPPRVSKDNLSVKVSPSWFYRLPIALLNHAWRKDKRVFGDDDYASIYRSYWQSKDIGMAMISLSEDITSAFMRSCEKEHVTVNSALTTAFAFAQHDLQGQNKSYLRKALVAINIRGFFRNPPGDNIGFLAGGVEVSLPIRRGDFWQAAREFNIRMVKLRADPKTLLKGVFTLDHVEPTLMDSVYFTAYGTFRNKTALDVKNLVLTSTGKPRRSLDITNAGLINLDDETKLETIFFVPILSSNYEKAIGIATAGGKMNIVILHDNAQFSSASMEDFKQKIVSYIGEVCSS